VSEIYRIVKCYHKAEKYVGPYFLNFGAMFFKLELRLHSLEGDSLGCDIYIQYSVGRSIE
jgi:hypothetical protein